MKTNSKSLAVVMLVLLAWTTSVKAQAFKIDWFTVDGGGGSSSAGIYALSGAIGQPDAGMSSGGTFAVQGGFWGLQAVVQTPSPGSVRLAFARSGGNIILFWPATATGFVLEEAASLATPINWQPVSQTPLTMGSDQAVTLSVLGSPRFYRLRLP